jgi:hypothetical protein
MHRYAAWSAFVDPNPKEVRMKSFAYLASLAACLLAFSTPACAADPGIAEAVVQAQLNAYNARDIDAFLATYSDDVEVYDFPASLRLKGKQAMRARYSERFADQTLHATIAKRIAMDNTVIDHEHVRLQFPDGPGTLNAVAIYDVRDGKIAKVTFIMGTRLLDSAAAAKP